MIDAIYMNNFWFHLAYKPAFVGGNRVSSLDDAGILESNSLPNNISNLVVT